jgi:hypothetical protein
LELFPSSSRAQRHWKVSGKKGLIYIHRRHSAGSWHNATASSIICAGGQLRPLASTDTFPGGLLSEPLAHLSEYIRSERGLTQLLTHSHTLAPNPSRHRKQPRAPPQPQPTLPPPPRLVSFARVSSPQPPSANCRPTLQPPVPRPTSSRFSAIAWRVAPRRQTLANSCLSPYWPARRVGSGLFGSRRSHMASSTSARTTTWFVFISCPNSFD